jgi:hypothetical protein
VVNGEKIWAHWGWGLPINQHIVCYQSPKQHLHITFTWLSINLIVYMNSREGNLFCWSECKEGYVWKSLCNSISSNENLWMRFINRDECRIQWNPLPTWKKGSAFPESPGAVLGTTVLTDSQSNSSLVFTDCCSLFLIG